LHTALFSHFVEALLSSCPDAMFEQVPTEPATLQAWHVVVHASLQQTPSTQLPLTHSFADPHVAPRIFLHTPLPSHWFWPVQTLVGLLSGCMAGILLHVPTLPVTLHALHAVLHELLQQTPSAQLLFKHVLLTLQGWPFSLSHSPALQDTLSPVQVPSSTPLGTLTHLPRLPETLHDLHAVVQLFSQQ
jgi:hypothetical protein